jgi:glycosyltransferase involved in cell wall biosynthesis
VRIAHLDTGRTWRGGQNQVLLLARGLATRGHESVILAPRGPLLARAEADGIGTRAWRPAGDFDLRAAARAHDVLGGWRPDIVHAHSAHAQLPAVSLARHVGAAVIVSRRVLPEMRVNLLSRWKYAQPVGRYLCVSEAVLESMARSGVAPARLALVPSGVDLGAVATLRARAESGGAGLPRLREEIGAAAAAPLVGTVAALTREKGHEVLLEAVAEVSRARPDVRFVWIGDGPARGRLERELARRGLDGTVRLLGFRDDVQPLVVQLTLFVLASHREGLGTSLLEAQALGVPVLATRSGGVSDVIEDGRNGALATAETLGATILSALGDPDRLLRWRCAALESVKAYGSDAMVTRTLAEYEAVLSERGDRARVGE